MHNPAYLMLSRHNVYYFRWPIPPTLRPQTSATHVVLSLGTRKPAEALHLSRLLEYHASQLIKQYGPRLMKHHEIKTIIKQYLQAVLNKSKQDVLDNGPFSATRIQALEKEILTADFTVELASENLIPDNHVMAKIISAAGLNIPNDSEDYTTLRLTYYRALPAVYREIIRFSQEHENFDFGQAPILGSPSPAPQQSAHPLSLTAERFVKMQMEDQKWDENTKNERLAHIAILHEILGTGFNIQELDAEKARHVRDIIRRLPKNKNKHPKLKGLSLMQSLEVPNMDKLAPATISKYMETYSALFGWAVDEGYIEKNHFHTLRTKGAPKNQPKRQAFTETEIKALLHETLKGRDGIANKDYRYWGTLIGIYTGARLNEISQIMLDDIKQTDGIWYFDMNDDGDNKKLKTEASRRYVPVHKELLDLGLIEYRDKLKKQGKARLLHELTYCPKNGYGKKLGHFFNQVFLPELKLKKDQVVFHCLRHTTVTRLLQAGEDLAIVQSIVGHERSGTALKNYFQEGYKLSRLKEAIDKLHLVVETP